MQPIAYRTRSHTITYSEDTMKLGLCLNRVIHQDDTLTNIIITPACLDACSDWEPSQSDEENESLDGLTTTARSGDREWLCNLGVRLGKLTNLTHLTFDGLDPDDKDLEGFWGEIAVSTSLTDLYFINMNLISCEEMLATASAPNITNITFQRCSTISNEIGYDLHDLLHQDNHLTTLCFIECSFNNTNTMKEIVNFATELAHLTSIRSFSFTSCSFDNVQSMCLVRCLNEESVNPVDVHISP